jgi:hypothetical protein
MTKSWNSCLRGSWFLILTVFGSLQVVTGQTVSRLPPTGPEPPSRYAWLPTRNESGVPNLELEIPFVDSSPDWSESVPASQAGWSFRTCRDFGALLYFQTEATFLSQGSELPASQFALSNSTPSLTVPAGSLPSSATFFPPPNDFIAQSTYNPYLWNWTVGSAQPLSSTQGSLGGLDAFTGAPRLTLGLVFETGVGLQVRYWTLENGSAGVVPLGTGAMTYAGTVQATSGAEQFRAQTIDFELTKDLLVGNWELLGTFGFRQAQVDHQRTDTAFGRIRTGASETGQAEIPNINLYSPSLYSFASGGGSSFDGAGLTFSLQGLRPIVAHPAWALFLTARGSTLFGETNSWAQSSVAYSSFYGSGAANDLERIRDHETLMIGELQAGLQWCPQFHWTPGRFFFRAAVEYQYWRALGDQALASATTGDRGMTRSLPTPPSTQVPPNATSVVGGYNFWTNPAYLGGIGTTQGSTVARGGQVDFDLIGLALTAGFVY